MRRREFLHRGVLGGTALAVCQKGAWASADSKIADSRVEVLLDEPIGMISPNIYGHFT
jgi:hypothetical protein